MVHFDENGHLYPYEIIKLGLLEFESLFVENLPDTSHRKHLFGEYLKFVDELRIFFPISFVQWVGGSFITTKELPGDIDVVTFLPYDTLVRKAVSVQHIIQSAKINFSVDAAFCPVCKWNHRFYQESKSREAYWLRLYTHARSDMSGKKQPKGLIKIHFQP